MTIGDKTPDKFERGQRLTAAGLNSLSDAILSMIRKLYGPQIARPLNVTGILNGELVSATAFASSPATATMAVWQKDSSGNMVDSTRDITVVNRMIKISLPAGTIAQAEWIDGEWRIYAADCA